MCEHWQQPQSGKRGCCFSRKRCQMSPILEKARNSHKTLCAHRTQQTWTHSVLGSKCDRACRLALHCAFSTSLSMTKCFVNMLLYSPQMRPFLPHFPFIAPAIASKNSVQTVYRKQSFLSDFHACAINAQPILTTTAFLKLTHYLPLALGEREETERLLSMFS